MSTPNPVHYQVTIWGDKHERIATQWGKLEYERYLQKEIERWYDKDCTLAWVEVDKKSGHIAMFTPWQDKFMEDFQ